MTSLNPQTLNQEARERLHTFAEVVERVMQNNNMLSSNVAITPSNKKQVWEVVKYDGSWVRSVTAGGAPNNPSELWLLVLLVCAVHSVIDLSVFLTCS